MMIRFITKLGFWQIVMVFFVCLNYGSDSLMEGGSWTYDIFMGGQKVGFSQITSTAINESRLETVSKVHFELVRGIKNIKIDLGARTVYEWPAGIPVEYDLTLSSGGVPTIITGTFKENEANIQVKTGPQEFKNKIAIEGDEFVLDNNFLIEHYLVLVSGTRLEKDQTREVDFIVPQIAQRFPQAFQMQIVNLGVKEVTDQSGVRNLLKWESTGNTGLKMEFWIDPVDHSLVRWAVPSQMTEVVLVETQGEEPIDPVDLNQVYSHLLERYYIPSYLEMGDFQEVESLRIRLDLCVISQEGIPESPTQSFNGEVIKNSTVFCYEGIVQNSLVSFNGQDASELVADMETSGPFLSDTVDFPSKSEEILSITRELTNQDDNRWKAAKTIGQWIFENIQYEITGAGALDCLKTRKGDCGPKSLLAISMLRSVGVPSRLVGGLLYVGGKFGQHNWVEVEVIPGYWIPIDPTTGEINRFSASHIALWQGMGALAPDARPMKIEVLAFSRTE